MVKSKNAIYSTILLVDDDLDFLMSTRGAIVNFFEKVIVTSCPLVAIEILNYKKIDLVVTDYILPNMTGIELINYSKSHYPLIPVIMLTEIKSNPEVILAIEEGAFDVIEKPCHPQVLINRIENGLLLPELVKTAWKHLRQDLSLPKMEEFLRMSLKEQNQFMYAYSLVGKMKSVISTELKTKEKIRAKIRFKPEKNETCFVSFNTEKFCNEFSALLINESSEGACFVINKKNISQEILIQSGISIYLKIGNLEPIKSVLRWSLNVDSDIVKIGVQHPIV